MKTLFTWLKQKKWFMIALLAVVVVGGIWWNNKQHQTKKITTVHLELRDITQVLKVSGKIDADEKVRMTFAGASKLTWLGVKEGDVVKKYQGLASVDSRTLANSLQMAQNAHGIQFRAFENSLDSVDYYSESGLSESERRTAETAQLNLRNSALTVESADIAVKLAHMSSPIQGLVTKIDQKNVGALMLPTDGIEIVNPTSIVFSAVVDEEDISKVTASMAATVKLDAFEDQSFPSTIKRVSFTPTVSESGGTGYTVWLSLPVDNRMMNYKLGMNGDAEIVLSQVKQVPSIPVDALIERDGVMYVDVLESGKPTRREVGVGPQDDTYVAVTSGLTANDLVVVPTK